MDPHLIQKATGEPHIKALPVALNHLPRISLPPVSPISPPSSQLKSRVMGDLADNRLQRSFTGQVFC